MSKRQPAGRSSDTGSEFLPHRGARYVLSTPAVTRPADKVVVQHCRAPERGSQRYSEIVPLGRCQMTIALWRGRARVHRNGRLMHEGPVFPGMVRVAEPGDRIEGETSSAVEAISIDMPASRLSGWWAGMTAHVRPIRRPDARTEQLGRMLIDSLQEEGRHRALFGQGVIDALLATVLDHDSREQVASRGKAVLASEELQRLLDYADAHISKTVGLADLAAVLDLPAQEFARRFRQTTGSAPYAYFLRRRVGRAKEMLTETNARLVEIALETGFGSQSHFTETFRRIAGISPGEWRRQR